MPNVIHICKAENSGVDSATIYIDVDLPPAGNMDNLDNWIRKQQEWHDREARLLEETLHATLTGGTYDALMIRMLERRASVYRVTHPRVEQ